MVTVVRSVRSIVPPMQIPAQILQFSQNDSSGGSGSVGSSSAVVTIVPRMTAPPWSLVITLPEYPNQPTPEATARMKAFLEVGGQTLEGELEVGQLLDRLPRDE